MSKREEIKQACSAFTDKLMKLMRESAAEVLEQAFADDSEDADEAPATAPARKARRPRRARTEPVAAEPASGSVQKRLLTAIRSNPGCDGGTIAQELGMKPWQFRPVLNDLVITGAVKKTGNGRGTRYSPR